MLCSMVGGGMIPLEFLPDWISPISKLSPIRWAIFAIQGGIWRPLTWSGMIEPLAILVGIGVVGYAVALKVFGNAERT
jgi:ABC-type multidrug transport system permease subunit